MQNNYKEWALRITPFPFNKFTSFLAFTKSELRNEENKFFGDCRKRHVILLRFCLPFLPYFFICSGTRAFQPDTQDVHISQCVCIFFLCSFRFLFRYVRVQHMFGSPLNGSAERARQRQCRALMRIRRLFNFFLAQFFCYFIKRKKRSVASYFRCLFVDWFNDIYEVNRLPNPKNTQLFRWYWLIHTARWQSRRVKCHCDSFVIIPFPLLWLISHKTKFSRNCFWFLFLATNEKIQCLYQFIFAVWTVFVAVVVDKPDIV